MSFRKKYLAIVLAILAVMTTTCSSFASTKKDKIYQEYHEQINFDDLIVSIVNKKNIIVTVDPTISFYKKNKAKNEKKKYDRYIESHPDAETELIETTNSNECICTISYTEAPLQYVNDHYERIEEENSHSLSPLIISAGAEDKVKSSESSSRYRFTLKTTIIRRGTSNPYTYTARTSGTWDNSVSVTGGQKKPAGGNDFVMQACPTITNRATFSSTYNYATNNSKKGQEGINYWQTDGGNSWVKYEVVDDPAGLAQLETFNLSQTFSAKYTTKTKKINSYYIHTWKQMNIKVTAAGNVGLSGDVPSVGVSLSYTPEIQEKQWQVYDFVSFNW